MAKASRTRLERWLSRVIAPLPGCRPARIVRFDFVPELRDAPLRMDDVVKFALAASRLIDSTGASTSVGLIGMNS
jgi:hypothetical protein